MRGIVSALVLSLALVPTLGGLAHAQTALEFKLGFKLLADQIPQIVGKPLEDEQWAPNGDYSWQRTTTGLMMWRKADNWTAFSDGRRTWIIHDGGVMPRLNSERFPWESGAPLPDWIWPMLTTDELKNADYSVYEGESTRLVDGTAPLKPRGKIWLQDNLVRFGDLDGDGIEDAAVVIGYNTGGSGSFSVLAAMVNRDGVPMQEAGALLGDRVAIERMQVTPDGEIQIRMVTQGPNDPMCCPTMRVDIHYRLIDGQLRGSVP